MIEDLPLISINIRIYKFWSFLLGNTWRRYLCYMLCFTLNIAQLFDMFMTSEAIEVKIRYAYGFGLWFDTNLRGIMLGARRFAHENFFKQLETLYLEIKNNATDSNIIKLLDDTTSFSRKLSIINLMMGSIVYSFYLPYFNKLATPYYEIIYVYMTLITPIGCMTYIPYSSLIVSSLLFGILMCKILQYRLLNLHGELNSEKELMDKVVWCVQYQLKLIDYIQHFNKLISYLFLIEFIIFGAILCALLFMFLIVNDVPQTLIVSTYILMIFGQIASFSWFANELYEESLKIAYAAYSTDWIHYSSAFKKSILLLILRSHKPLAMKIGNVFDLNLTQFQSLMNTTYSAFTLLRRFY
ncbi:odorant receptor 30a-like [Condylostylus longicornis]|uniref:odorant receptor 30a-like n=1 Tax=Condylostylus longicornis TaxID=2530218 RepID=UPI00244DC655|nr:odorant receptor 30a-like [Condylostylus longicornis]